MKHVGHRFSRPMIGDADGLFMANYEVAARHLADRLRCHRVMELCCGIGATTVCLAETCDEVYGVDCDARRLEYARTNAAAWGVSDRVRFICGDALDETLLRSLPRPHVVFADPEWEPAEHPLSEHARDPRQTQPPTDQLVAVVRSHVTENIVLRMPLETELEHLRPLGPCEVEQVNIDGQPKFSYLYYGAPARRPARTEMHLTNLRRRPKHPG
jgi:16S rRNA G966 N2-methylase RsmD